MAYKPRIDKTSSKTSATPTETTKRQQRDNQPHFGGISRNISTLGLDLSSVQYSGSDCVSQHIRAWHNTVTMVTYNQCGACHSAHYTTPKRIWHDSSTDSLLHFRLCHLASRHTDNSRLAIACPVTISNISALLLRGFFLPVNCNQLQHGMRGKSCQQNSTPPCPHFRVPSINFFGFSGGINVQPVKH